MEYAISVKDLYKSFKNVNAVNGLSFDVEKGSVFAFLGLNGAGKSTTINILCTILRKNSGEVSVAGYNVETQAELIKSKIGIVFQNSVLDDKLTVLENLQSRASLYGLTRKQISKKINELVETFDLSEFKNRAYAKLSGGQRRRVDIARALICEPEVLFLDEPTTGLDPTTRIKVWKIIDDLRHNKKLTVFFTTHYMEETAKADKIAIIDAGKIVAEGTPAELKSKYAKNYIKIYEKENEEINAILLKENLNFDYKYNAYYVIINNSADGLKFLNKHKQFDNFEIIKGDMDDVFLTVTGKNLLG